MTLLSWERATKSDRGELQQFVCTSPARAPRWPNAHPKMWELEVQSGIRDLRPPEEPGTTILLGRDDLGLAAVTVFSVVDAPDLVKWRAVAVASRLRGQGGAHAQEALEVTLQAVLQGADEAGLQSVDVFGWIHEENEPSQRLCSQAGFVHVENLHDRLQGWLLTLDIGADPASVPGTEV